MTFQKTLFQQELFGTSLRDVITNTPEKDGQAVWKDGWVFKETLAVWIRNKGRKTQIHTSATIHLHTDPHTRA